MRSLRVESGPHYLDHLLQVEAGVMIFEMKNCRH